MDIKKVLKKYFIDTLSFMALGLFSTLIIGSILNQIGTVLGIEFLTETVYPALKDMTSPVIAIAVAYGLRSDPLVIFSCAAGGFIGGDPISALLAGIAGSFIGMLVSKKTNVDIIVTPFLTILSASIVAYFAGPVMQSLLTYLGKVIMNACELQPFFMGIIVSALMGIFLTLPISSAAIGIMLNLSGIAAGAACAGCSAHMIGFAVMSFKENGVQGLIAQGIGTSMLQIKNLMKKPVLWIPPVIASIVTGPVSTVIFKMTNMPYGAGMGTSGLVGQFGAVEAMGAGAYTFISILIVHIILPAVITLLVSTYMRKKNIIKSGDLKLDI